MSPPLSERLHSPIGQILCQNKNHRKLSLFVTKAEKSSRHDVSLSCFSYLRDMDNSELTFRPARPGEQERILEIIGQAQAQMHAAGSDQWQDGYPARADIDADIARGAGHVLCRANGTIIAYGALFFDGEPSYATIRGAWTTAGDYVVLHRLAVADGEKCRGVATEFLRRTASLARRRGTPAFRVDTNFDNRPMLHLMEKEHFVYCGKIRCRNGERLAFEKRLLPPEKP